ncbi:MAG TPA: hypothetical protein VGL22_02145 [Terracidiphilus sp.]|jgi:hypothetical protein
MELIELIAGLILEVLGIASDFREDLKNRNNRGLLKRASSKYVV